METTAVLSIRTSAFPLRRKRNRNAAMIKSTPTQTLPARNGIPAMVKARIVEILTRKSLGCRRYNSTNAQTIEATARST